jgi:hypothetical protein
VPENLVPAAEVAPPKAFGWHGLQPVVLGFLMATVVAGCNSTPSGHTVDTLHGTVPDGLMASLYNTHTAASYVFDAAPLCTTDGIRTQIVGVHPIPAIVGSIAVQGWGVLDSAKASGYDTSSGPGAVAGRISDYPHWTHAPVVNPCSASDRSTDLIVQLTRKATSTSAVPGLLIDYRTKEGSGQLKIIEQLALCAKPNSQPVCKRVIAT